jgi:20S proteasome subunit beta 7
LIGAKGEMSDFQSVMNMLDGMHQEDLNLEDGYTRKPKEIYNYLRAVMYQRRSKGDPLWNQLVIGGYRDTEGDDSGAFLGYVDLIGTAYEENFIATGFGAYLAIPIIREKWSKDMDETEARTLLEDCMRVLFYRDCRASARIQIAKATADGTLVSDPYVINTDWDTATYDSRHNMPLDGSTW